MKPQQMLTLRVKSKDGKTRDVPVRSRIDTPIEIEYYKHGGILPYVLRQLLAKALMQIGRRLLEVISAVLERGGKQAGGRRVARSVADGGAFAAGKKPRHAPGLFLLSLARLA